MTSLNLRAIISYKVKEVKQSLKKSLLEKWYKRLDKNYKPCYTSIVVKILQKNYKKVEFIMENKTVETVVENVAKITKAEALQMAVEIVGMLETQEQPIGLLEKLEQMHEQQVKTDSRKRNKKGESKTAKEKAENMEKVRTFFIESEEPLTLTLDEIKIAIGLNDATPQKMSAIMKGLVDEGTFERTTKDKKVAFAPVQ